MSTIAEPRHGGVSRPAQEDPFRYGWRDIPRQLPDGKWDSERQALTLEDVLHPQMGDVIVESTLHDLMRAYLADVLRARTADDPTALILSNVGVYWDDPDLKHHSPDVTAIFGVEEANRPRKSFDVAEEGVRPTALMELVSPATRKNDVETKFEQYHRARVPIYVIIDQKRDGADLELHGYFNTPTGYLEMSKDSRGRLWLEPLGIWLGLKDGRVVCYDGVTDEEIGDYTRISQELAQVRERAKAEEARADAEAQARRVLETRLQEIEAELARLRKRFLSEGAEP